MKLWYFWFLVMFIVYWADPVLGSTKSSVGTKVISLSEQKKSFAVQMGELAGVKDGDQAKVVYQQSMNGELFELIGTAKVTKIYPTYSYWYFLELIQPELMTKGSSVIMEIYSDMLKGRRPYRLLQRKIIVHSEEEKKKYSLERLKGYQSHPSYKKKQYDYFNNDLGSDNNEWEDEKLEDIGIYKSGQRGVLYPQEYEDRVDVLDTTENILLDDTQENRTKMDEEVVGSYIVSTSESVYNHESLEDLYKDVMRVDGSGSQNKLSLLGEKDLFKDNAKFIRSSYREKNKNYKETSGTQWSTVFDDKGLRRYIVKSGILEEKRQQAAAQKKKEGHEFILRYGFEVTENTDINQGQIQGVSHRMEIGGEFHLGQTTKALEHFTLEGVLALGTDYYDLGDDNFQSREFLTRIGLNWYFIHPPSKIKTYIWYLGAGILAGTAKVATGSKAELFEYDISSYSSYHFGFKYRFSGGDELDNYTGIGIGVSLVGRYEQKELIANDGLRIDKDMLAQEAFNDFTIVMGLNLYF